MTLLSLLGNLLQSSAFIHHHSSFIIHHQSDSGIHHRCSRNKGNRNRNRNRKLKDRTEQEQYALALAPDAAAVGVLSKKLWRVFTLVTSFDFHDSPISHCLNCPHQIERYPTYTTFVDNVLQACQSTQHLTSFRLRLGRDPLKGTFSNIRISHDCVEGCFPEMNPTQLNAWICFPLTRQVRELDLSIHVRKPGGKLPREIFTCETLEVLKLNVRLDISTMSSSYLPNLKLLHLSAIVIPNKDFVTLLVSSCPSLEDFTLEYCRWEEMDMMENITISSPSLRRLVLNMVESRRWVKCHELECAKVVFIETPNLQQLRYIDNLAWTYTFTCMNALVTADIQIINQHDDNIFQSMLSLVRSLSNVQRLSLREMCLETLDSGWLKNQLPVFHHLSYLELGCTPYLKWDQVLLEFLNCSPCLETLAFTEGISYNVESDFAFTETCELELSCWRTTQKIPSCVRSNLKRIVIEDYLGTERELRLVKFFLSHASILEELAIYWYLQYGLRNPRVDRTSHECALKKLPRASNTCSIRIA